MSKEINREAFPDFVRALAFAPRKHSQQRRKDVNASPYINHPIALVGKVVGRIAKDLIANDEAEVSEVVRRRLFEDLGSESNLKKVSKAYAD